MNCKYYQEPYNPEASSACALCKKYKITNPKCYGDIRECLKRRNKMPKLKEEKETKEVTLPSVLNEAQVNLIRNQTPKEHIKQRKGRAGMTYDYVTISYVIEQLNRSFGFCWDFEIVEQGILETEVWVKGKLTVKAPRNSFTITKTQYGGSDIKIDKQGKKLSIADDLKSAASDCLKKCASLIGIALDIYGGEINNNIEIEETPEMQVKAAEIADALRQAKNLMELDEIAKGYKDTIKGFSSKLQDWLRQEYNSVKTELTKEV